MCLLFGKSEKKNSSAGIKNRPIIYIKNKKYIKIKEHSENVISDLNFIAYSIYWLDPTLS